MSHESLRENDLIERSNGEFVPTALGEVSAEEVTAFEGRIETAWALALFADATVRLPAAPRSISRVRPVEPVGRQSKLVEVGHVFDVVDDLHVLRDRRADTG